VRADEFEAAGIYDPGAPLGGQRLELLEYLAGRGVSLAAMVAAARSGGLAALASELALQAPGDLTGVEEVARRSGTTVDRVRRVRLASGFPGDVGDFGAVGAVGAVGARPEFGLPSSAVDDVVSFEAGAAMFGEAPTLSFTRVMGAAVAKVAEAAVSLFLSERRPTLAPEASELDLAKAAEEATATFIAVTPRLMANMLREHMTLAIRRSVAERTLEVDDRAVTVGIGFVDLVGSTRWAEGLTLKEHALAMAGFESAAWDIASAHGGRVVKLIGDEAMFIAPSGAEAAGIALELCRRVGADAALPEARAGVGHGTVGSRDGDYFGPLVNLVARAVKVAEPGWVVVTENVRSRLGDDPASGESWEVVELPEQVLRGIDQSVRLFALH
jgi:adenylate cyclase